MDYNFLIEILRNEGMVKTKDDIDAAATAIETLLAERDGLCDIIRRKYPQSLNRECIHYDACYEDAVKNKKAGMRCLSCKKWEWRGLTEKGDENIGGQ